MFRKQQSAKQCHQDARLESKRWNSCCFRSFEAFMWTKTVKKREVIRWLWTLQKLPVVTKDGNIIVLFWTETYKSGFLQVTWINDTFWLDKQTPTVWSRRTTCYTATTVYSYQGPQLRLNMFSLSDIIRCDENRRNCSHASGHTSPIA